MGRKHGCKGRGTVGSKLPGERAVHKQPSGGKIPLKTIEQQAVFILFSCKNPCLCEMGSDIPCELVLPDARFWRMGLVDQSVDPEVVRSDHADG